MTAKSDKLLSFHSPITPSIFYCLSSTKLKLEQVVDFIIIPFSGKGQEQCLLIKAERVRAEIPCEQAIDYFHVLSLSSLNSFIA